MKKLTSMVFALFLSGVATIGLYGQAPVTEKLASGNFVIFATSPQIWRVRVDPRTMSNITIAGHFSVTAGNPKAIDVFVFDEANYTKWQNDDDPQVRASAKPIASVMKSADGNINARLTDAGYHFLVISNKREYEGKKTIAAEINLQYEKR